MTTAICLCCDTSTHGVVCVYMCLCCDGAEDHQALDAGIFDEAEAILEEAETIGGE